MRRLVRRGLTGTTSTCRDDFEWWCPGVRRLWVTREIEAPAHILWNQLVTPELWPAWGPSVRRATLDDGRLRLGATGTVTSVIGAELRFEVTTYEEGSRWAWSVIGLPATDHAVDAIGSDRCRVGFGVPWLAAPYLAVCRSALRRLDELSTPLGVAARE